MRSQDARRAGWQPCAAKFRQRAPGPVRPTVRAPKFTRVQMRQCRASQSIERRLAAGAAVAFQAIGRAPLADTIRPAQWANRGRCKTRLDVGDRRLAINRRRSLGLGAASGPDGPEPVSRLALIAASRAASWFGENAPMFASSARKSSLFTTISAAIASDMTMPQHNGRTAPYLITQPHRS